MHIELLSGQRCYLYVQATCHAEGVLFLSEDARYDVDLIFPVGPPNS
ncbi:hypothetical protein [Sodalis-like endosymbiont of Proechinophthirus fluctus]|nr:hypothetical protein [Sodalis-like endosymbiont of Proechinophthirus fluctus]